MMFHMKGIQSCRALSWGLMYHWTSACPSPVQYDPESQTQWNSVVYLTNKVLVSVSVTQLHWCYWPSVLSFLCASCLWHTDNETHYRPQLNSSSLLFMICNRDPKQKLSSFNLFYCVQVLQLTSFSLTFPQSSSWNKSWTWGPQAPNISQGTTLKIIRVDIMNMISLCIVY